MWMMLGPLALCILTFLIMSAGTGWATGLDAAFFLTLGAILLGRYLEFRGGNPQTATGEPAAPEDLPRFLLVCSVAGLVAWVVANLVGNHILPSL
jgi:hypothetical protein